MGKYQDVGNPLAALAEECSEVIQVITKAVRFSDGDLNAIAPNSDPLQWPYKTRLDLLEEEMNDVIYQWERLKKLYNK